MDPVEVVAWFRNAAEQGHREAQYVLSTCYHEGLGVTKSLPLSAAWNAKAADAGHVRAREKVAALAEHHLGGARART